MKKTLIRPVKYKGICRRCNNEPAEYIMKIYDDPIQIICGTCLERIRKYKLIKE